MKEKLTLRNLLVCCAALFGLLVFIFSFITSVKSIDKAGEVQQIYNNMVWGCATVSNGTKTMTQTLDPKMNALALPLVGAILVFVGAICACVVAFVGEKLVKKEMARKIVMLVAGGMMVVGAVFVALTPLGAFEEMARYSWEYGGAKAMFPDIEAFKEYLRNQGGSLSAPMSIVSAVLAVLGGGAVIAAQFVPDKKLVK